MIAMRNQWTFVSKWLPWEINGYLFIIERPGYVEMAQICLINLTEKLHFSIVSNKIVTYNLTCDIFLHVNPCLYISKDCRTQVVAHRLKWVAQEVYMSHVDSNMYSAVFVIPSQSKKHLTDWPSYCYCRPCAMVSWVVTTLDSFLGAADFYYTLGKDLNFVFLVAIEFSWGQPWINAL